MKHFIKSLVILVTYNAYRVSKPACVLPISFLKILSKKLWIPGVLIISFLPQLNAQQIAEKVRFDCQEALRDAKTEFLNEPRDLYQKLYQQFIHSPCLEKGGLTWEEKVDLYEMLIVLNQQTKRDDEGELERQATELYKTLLNIHPEYNAKKRLIQRLGAYDKAFDRLSRFSMGIRTGANLSMVQILRAYEIDIDDGNSPENYAIKINNARPILGLSISYPLNFLNKKNHWYPAFELSAEVLYKENAFAYQRDLRFSSNNTPFSPDNYQLNFTALSFNESHKSISTPILLRWRKPFGVPNEAKLFFNVHGGFTLNYLINAKLNDLVRSNIQTLPGNPDVGVQSLEEVNVSNQRRKLNFGWIAGTGFLYKIVTGVQKRSIGFLSLDIRYQYDMKNQVINRFANQELNYLYGYGQSDFGLRHFAIVIGYSFTFFNPKHLQEAEK